MTSSKPKKNSRVRKTKNSKKDIVFSGDWNSCYHYLSEKESILDNLN